MTRSDSSAATPDTDPFDPIAFVVGDPDAPVSLDPIARAGGEPAIIAAARAHAIEVCRTATARYASDARFRFDAQRADRACEFFPRFLRHSQGAMAGKPFELEEWEREIVRAIFGWLWVSSGYRVIRRLYLFIARKNGKSTFAAGLALLMLLADGEQGGQVYSAAADKDQASIVFGEAVNMVRQSEPLSRVTECFKGAIVCSRLNASYKVLSSDADTKHGLNPSGVVFDELHTQPNRDLVDVLHTALGTRAQPLEAYMTTAGYDRHSICYEMHDYAIKVRDGVVEDPSFLPMLFGAADDDDWTDPLVWGKANPSVGTAIGLNFLAEECARAQATPGYQNTFRRLHLNQWTEQSSRWLDIATWDKGAGTFGWDGLEEHLAGRRCYAAIDLSSTTDITALILVFPPDELGGRWHCLCRFWVPEENMRKRAERDRVPYPQWLDQGAIKTTDGNVVDYRAIEQQLQQDARDFRIVKVPYDPWNATQMATNLQDQGVEVVEFRQGFASMAGPTRELERIVTGELLEHGGHPVLRWMASNVAVTSDAAGNMKPAKDKSGDRIDGIVGLIMGIGAAQADGEEQSSSIYENEEAWR